MKDRGTTQTVSFNVSNLILHEYVIKLAKEKFSENISYAIMDCIKSHRDNQQISMQDLINTLMSKIDNLSLVGVSIEQTEQVKKEVKEVVSFNLGEGGLFE